MPRIGELNDPNRRLAQPTIANFGDKEVTVSIKCNVRFDEGFASWDIDQVISLDTHE
jgi:hypothetical protein